jgi:thiamine-monophosphate kinase
MSDEFSRIALIRERLCTPAADVDLGIGDDAAVLSATFARDVVSVDAAVEGVHFRREFASWRQIGFRSLVAALSDLAAMGARPRAMLVSLILPAEFRDAELLELVEGMSEAARVYGSPVVGGNLSAGAQVSITTTVIGAATGEILTRSGARPQDRIYVTGTLGAAGLGLGCLKAGCVGPAAAPFIDRWRRPIARIDEGQLLLGVASAAIDLSDGLLQDLGHLCEASGVGADVTLRDLPLGSGAVDLAAQLGLDALDLALGGGEDYELIFTVPAGEPLPSVGTCIGTINANSGSLLMIDPHGQRVPATRDGYRHFR